MANRHEFSSKQLAELSLQLGRRAEFSKQALAVEQQYLAETNPVNEAHLYNEMWHLRRQASDLSYAIRNRFGIKASEMDKADVARLMAERIAGKPRRAARARTPALRAH